MAASPLSSVGSILQSVGQLLEAAAGGTGQAAPAQQPAAAAPQAPVDQFAPAPGGAPAPAAATAPAQGGDQLTQTVGQLVGMLQQLMGLLQQLLGGGQGQGQGAASAGAGAAAGSAAASAAAGASSPGASAGAASSPAASSSAAAAAAAAAAASSPPPEQPAPTSSGGDGGGGDGGGGGGGGDGGDPLVFDLGGKGVGFDGAHQTTANLNGKGGERINDLAAGTGLLTFAGDPSKGVLANSFGDKTDLSRFGIKGDRADGTFSNGFTALRALGEHFGLIKPGDQTLSADDLKVLEQKAGVKMRVGGVNGQDTSLADLGISQINLGDPNAIESKAQATQDANGNLLQHQAGASFVMNGQTRGYADAWFKDQPAKAA